MTAQRMIGNAVMALELVTRLCPVSVRVGNVGIHAKSDGTFDVVTPGRYPQLAGFLQSHLTAAGIARTA